MRTTTEKVLASVRNASHNANRSPEISDRHSQADYRSLENRDPSLRKRSVWQPFARKYVQYAYRCSEMSGYKQHRSDTCPCRTCKTFGGKGLKVRTVQQNFLQRDFISTEQEIATVRTKLGAKQVGHAGNPCRKHPSHFVMRSVHQKYH